MGRIEVEPGIIPETAIVEDSGPVSLRRQETVYESTRNANIIGGSFNGVILSVSDELLRQKYSEMLDDPRYKIPNSRKPEGSQINVVKSRNVEPRMHVHNRAKRK